MADMAADDLVNRDVSGLAQKNIGGVDMSLLKGFGYL